MRAMMIAVMFSLFACSAMTTASTSADIAYAQARMSQIAMRWSARRRPPGTEGAMKELIAVAAIAAALNGADPSSFERLADLSHGGATTIAAPAFGWSGAAPLRTVRFGWW
jgi:hypothetical protein